ncbi:MAG: hypothetical protein ACYDHX_08465 [Methanothrix sp.]
MKEGQSWGYSADPPGRARPHACSKEAIAGPCVTWGRRMAMDGGLDNWIAANGNEGERALAGELRTRGRSILPKSTQYILLIKKKFLMGPRGPICL